METQVASQWVGIDVSKAKLDIALRPANKVLQVTNQESGQGNRILFVTKNTDKKREI